MPFEKGISGNPAGKPKGAKTKTTEQIREAFQALLENNLPQLQNDIGSLEAKDRLYFLLKLSEFVLPKLQSIEMKESDSQKTRIIIPKEFLEDDQD